MKKKKTQNFKSSMADSVDAARASAQVLLSMRNKGRKRAATAAVAPASPARREIPPRIRKRNRLFYNDDEDTTIKPVRGSPRKLTRLTAPPKKHSVNATTNAANAAAAQEKKLSQDTYFRLRNLLKLPKAHKWVCYEFFYSNIDRPLFKGDNDFCVCLRESFPRLKVRNLTRVEWCKIRRLMGKPRRCSTSFFAEERAALHAKRSKIRLLQQRKVTDVSHFRELPDQIPLPLVIGTKVTARLRKPQDGLFTGSVDAVDTSNSTYRVTFDKQGLGTHSIPDYEVLSNEPQEMMPLSAFQQTFRPRNFLFTPPRFTSESCSPHLENDPMLAGSSLKNRFHGLEGETLGGFPVKFLMIVVYLSKILNLKKEKIVQMKIMNTQAERMKSQLEPLTLEFQKRYASVVLDLEKLNKNLDEHLVDVQRFCLEIDPEHRCGENSETPEPPLNLRDKCRREAEDMVEWANRQLSGRKAPTVSPHIVDLVAGLTSVMLQVKALAENEFNSFELKSLNESLCDIKSRMDPRNARSFVATSLTRLTGSLVPNLSVFQNNVEIHVNHIQSGLSRLGNLHAFAEQNVVLQ